MNIPAKFIIGTFVISRSLNRTSRSQKGSHCEERSDVAIQIISSKAF